MKYALRIFGLLAVVFALYVVVGEQLVGSSGDAYVNTRLAVIRSPSDGTVQLSLGEVGSRVEANEALGSITPKPDDGLALLGPQQERAIYSADLETGGAASGAESRPLLQGRIAALDQLIEDREAQRLASASTGLRAPAGGIVWSISSYSGQPVAAGDTLATIADCSTSFIHASVDQGLYNRLSVGDAAQFRFHDGIALDVTVALLAGTGPRALLETLAINPSGRLLEGYSVFLAAPGLVEAGCPLGRTGRVVFSAGPLSGIGEWFSGIGL
ncbi:HlyD family efflux transporter periplasmic adaptor subunit [Devosia sp. PTR5]|uniref:HlyD family efflux transporter periplasmic adaptor subunit n=1 Tax=Devosia oryzisoli TaxID=2774138 RepID=A0A927FXN3_9HYPH|nr:HlyD family secretion protein [Devosia oryzisoli]MBD8067167.1 HlyD family efflux transporter periplasmic adaptor subunit [Devosia oryzisoli]